MSMRPSGETNLVALQSLSGVAVEMCVVSVPVSNRFGESTSSLASSRRSRSCRSFSGPAISASPKSSRHCRLWGCIPQEFLAWGARQPGSRWIAIWARVLLVNARKGYPLSFYWSCRKIEVWAWSATLSESPLMATAAVTRTDSQRWLRRVARCCAGAGGLPRELRRARLRHRGTCPCVVR